MTVELTPQKPSNLAIYWQAVRAYSFPASIVPILLGTVLALQQTHHLRLLPFLFTFGGGVLAHAAANIYNDYFDFKHGVDVRPDQGSGVLTQHLLSPQQMLRFGHLLAACALVCGGVVLLLMASTTASKLVAALVLFGALAAILYSIVLKRVALGDILIILTFGIGFSLGAYLTQGGSTQTPAILHTMGLSLPITSLVDAILHANNLRDRQDDETAGVHTLASLLPPLWGKALLVFLLFFPLLFVVVGAMLHLLPLFCLATLLSFPAILRAYRTQGVVQAAQAHLAFGLLYVLGWLREIMR